MLTRIELTNETTDLTNYVADYETMKLIKVEQSVPLKLILDDNGSIDFPHNQSILVKNRKVSIKKPALITCTITVELS